MSGYGTTPDSALAEARAILADVHTRTGHLSRSLDQPGLATAPDDEPHLAALLRQALRRIAVETGRVHVTASVSVETSEAWVELPGVLTGARIAQAVWEYASGRRALQVEHPNGVFVSTASGRPTMVRVGPEAVYFTPVPSEAGTLHLTAAVRSGFGLDGSGSELAVGLGLEGDGADGGDRIVASFPHELAAAAAFLVMAEHFEERAAFDLAERFAAKAEDEIGRYGADDRQAGFARATARPHG